ncbi:MAG: WecB/TagA/CpsF family glycosyltransferase [Agathobacter sp.]|nr:WecB/TagA/CpsF family glycosyltransferase [Agathobacter sp.]
MIKEITVAGTKLNSYTTLENLTRIGNNLDNNVFTGIEEVYMRTLLMAKEDKVVKEALESMDVTIVAENEILDAVGENTILRRHEIERREFFFQLMRILERNGYTVYILGDEVKEVEETCQYLTDEFSRLKLVGAKALEENQGSEEGVVNDINMIAPDVIISILPSPMQEGFFVEHKSKFSARIWYGAGYHKITGGKHTLGAKLVKKFREMKLKNIIERDEES